MSVEIKFDANQAYQREAIDSVVELFAGQESIEQGVSVPGFGEEGTLETFQEMVFGNSLSLTPETVRRNLRRVQDRKIELEDGSVVPAVAESMRRPLEDSKMPGEFSVEMETGTGKTYVYLRTIAELHRKYGFRKFVIIVPSVAIREGVMSSLRLLEDHIRDLYDGLQYNRARLRQQRARPRASVRHRTAPADHGDQHRRDDRGQEQPDHPPALRRHERLRADRVPARLSPRCDHG